MNSTLRRHVKLYVSYVFTISVFPYNISEGEKRMNQIQIGRFIAEARKAQNLTQRQLAEELSISDKTVSKWECGKGLPEVSLMLPLCSALNISVNDLLSGERVSEVDYQKKAEENMVNLMQEYEENKKRLISTTITGIIATTAFLTLIFIVSVYTEAISMPAKVVIIIIAVGIFAAGIGVAMQGECKTGYYQCKHCNAYFVPTFMAYQAGAHIFLHRRLKCPKCGEKSWCKKVLAKKSK